MTPVLIIAAFMVGSFALAVIIGKCMEAGSTDLHDGATMRADRAEVYRLAREQEQAAADEFRS